jgi:hypothetical protein
LTLIGTPAARTACTMRSASSSEIDSGFSQKIERAPAASAASRTTPWRWSGVTIETMSRSGCSRNSSR